MHPYKHAHTHTHRHTHTHTLTIAQECLATFFCCKCSIGALVAVIATVACALQVCCAVWRSDCARCVPYLCQPLWPLPSPPPPQSSALLLEEWKLRSYKQTTRSLAQIGFEEHTLHRPWSTGLNLTICNGSNLCLIYSYHYQKQLPNLICQFSFSKFGPEN